MRDLFAGERAELSHNFKRVMNKIQIRSVRDLKQTNPFMSEIQDETSKFVSKIGE